MEEDKEILYLLDIAINSYIENDILRLDVSDTTKNRLKRDLRKKFRDEDFIYDIKNNIGLIPKSLVKEKIEELEKQYKEIEAKYTEEQLDNYDVGEDDYIKMEKIRAAKRILQDLLERSGEDANIYKKT